MTSVTTFASNSYDTSTPEHTNNVPEPAPENLPKPSLSKRETEVLLAWIKADTKDEVAKELIVAAGTINTYLGRVRTKYAAVGRPAPTKASLVARALQDGLITLDEL